MYTFIGSVDTLQDAILLFEACRYGYLKRVQRRLNESEKREYIRPGRVFIWDEDEAQIKRWTDSRAWSPSRRFHERFLSYFEIEAKPEAVAPGGVIRKAAGLSKRCLSVHTLEGRHLHLVSYHSLDPESGAYPRPHVHPSLSGVTDRLLTHDGYRQYPDLWQAWPDSLASLGPSSSFLDRKNESHSIPSAPSSSAVVSSPSPYANHPAYQPSPPHSAPYSAARYIPPSSHSQAPRSAHYRAEPAHHPYHRSHALVSHHGLQRPRYERLREPLSRVSTPTYRTHEYYEYEERMGAKSASARSQYANAVPSYSDPRTFYGEPYHYPLPYHHYYTGTDSGGYAASHSKQQYASSSAPESFALTPSSPSAKPARSAPTAYQPRQQRSISPASGPISAGGLLARSSPPTRSSGTETEGASSVTLVSAVDAIVRDQAVTLLIA